LSLGRAERRYGVTVTEQNEGMKQSSHGGGETKCEDREHRYIARHNCRFLIDIIKKYSLGESGRYNYVQTLRIKKYTGKISFKETQDFLPHEDIAGLKFRALSLNVTFKRSYFAHVHLGGEK